MGVDHVVAALGDLGIEGQRPRMRVSGSSSPEGPFPPSPQVGGAIRPSVRRRPRAGWLGQRKSGVYDAANVAGATCSCRYCRLSCSCRRATWSRRSVRLAEAVKAGGLVRGRSEGACPASGLHSLGEDRVHPAEVLAFLAIFSATRLRNSRSPS